MMPVSKVDSSNYDLLGNQLVGESHAVRMRRARQNRSHVPTLAQDQTPTLAGKGLGLIGTRPGTTAYSVIAGLGAGALVGVLAPRYTSWSAGQTATAAIGTGAAVAIMGPAATGNPYAQALSTTERGTLIGAGLFGAVYLISANWDEIRDALGDAANMTTLGVGGLLALALIGATDGWLPFTDRSLSKLTVIGLPVLIAAAAAGFAHGAVRAS